MKRKPFLLVAGLMLLVATVTAEPHQLLVGDFSSPPQGEPYPLGWEPLVFEKVDSLTSYQHQFLEGKGVIMADSHGGASGLITKREIDPHAFPIISWSWKVANVLEKGDVTTRNGDDCSARLYIAFAYDPDKVNLWEKVTFNIIKLFYGEYPPIAAITYIWGNRAEVGAIASSPYTGRVKMIVLQSGEEKVGQWLHERRNIAEDYRKAFGEEAPLISGVGIMTDTDNTGESARSWYGDILFSRTELQGSDSGRP